MPTDADRLRERLTKALGAEPNAPAVEVTQEAPNLIRVAWDGSKLDELGAMRFTKALGKLFIQACRDLELGPEVQYALASSLKRSTAELPRSSEGSPDSLAVT